MANALAGFNQFILFRAYFVGERMSFYIFDKSGNRLASEMIWLQCPESAELFGL